MTYELVFDPRAFKEWTRLGDTVKNQFKKKLANVLVNPWVESLACMACLIATR